MPQVIPATVAPCGPRSWRGPVAKLAQRRTPGAAPTAGYLRPGPLMPPPVTGVSGISIAPTPAGQSLRSGTYVDCLSASSPVDNVVPNRGTALGNVLDATTAVRPFYARPGLQHALAGITAAYADGVHPLWGNLSAGIPLRAGDSTVLGSALDSGSGRLNLGFRQGAHTEAATVVVGDGLVSVGGAATVLHNNMLTSYAGSVMAWSDYIGIQASWFDLNTATGELAFVGGAVSQSADRTVTDLGACPPHLAPRLLQARGLAPHTALRRLEIRHAQAFSASLRGMVGHVFVAVQGRLGLSRGTDTTYRKFVGEKVACEALFERRGVRQFFRDKARALRWRSERLRLPSLRRPEAMPLGDEMTRVQSGAWICSVLVGNLAAWAGVQINCKGDLSICVRKIDTDVVEVAYTPLSVRTMALVATGALGLQATLDKSPARALRQVFTFDLKHAAARRAYREALAGRLPGALPKKLRKRANQAPGRPAAIAMLEHLQAALRQEKHALPEGVARVYAHALLAVQKRCGGGLHFYFLPRFMLPRGWEPGWMRHRIRLQESEAIVAPELTKLTDTRATEARSEQVWRGLQSRRAAAVLREETTPAGGEQRSVTLQATVVRGHMPVKRLNRKVLAKLNRKFNLALPPHAPMAGKRAWLVEIRRTFDAGDIKRMADLYSPSVASRRSFALRMAALGHRTGVRPKVLAKFVRATADQPDAGLQMRGAQSFVGRYGIAGIAALHALLGRGKAPLQVSLLQSGYDEDAKAGARLALKYGGPKPYTRKSKDQQKHELCQGIARLQRSMGELQANAVLSHADRTRLGDALAGHQRVLQAAFDAVA